MLQRAKLQKNNHDLAIFEILNKIDMVLVHAQLLLPIFLAVAAECFVIFPQMKSYARLSWKKESQAAPISISAAAEPPALPWQYVDLPGTDIL